MKVCRWVRSLNEVFGTCSVLWMPCLTLVPPFWPGSLLSRVLPVFSAPKDQAADAEATEKDNPEFCRGLRREKVA